MKSIKIIAVIMAVVLAGGVIVSLVGKKQDDTDGWLVSEPKEHEECVFSLATGVVPASSDPEGKGYEYFSCDECGQLLKVVANHESGHYFRTFSNGKQLCACGATIGLTDQLFGKNEFNNYSDGLLITNLDKGDYLVDLDGDDEYDSLNVALRNGQFFLKAENFPSLINMLEGKDDIGNVVDSVKISFDFHYSGDFYPVGEWDGHENLRYLFLNYQCSPDWRFSVRFEPLDGMIKVYEHASPDVFVVLSPDVQYRFDIIAIPETQRVFMAIEGDGLSQTVIFDVTVDCSPLSVLTQIGIGRSTFYCTNDAYGLYIDAFEVRCSLYAVNDKMVNEANLCDHDFKGKGIIDLDHPASEAWKKYTCKECGCWYYGH